MAGLVEEVGLHLLQFLNYTVCPECGESGRHDGDCSRDGSVEEPSRGLLGNQPPFQGTGFLGFIQLAEKIAGFHDFSQRGRTVLAAQP